MNISNENITYDMAFDPDAGLHRVYDFLPYSHQRIKQILEEVYHVRLQCVRAYKEGRYPGYKQRYYLYDIDTNDLIKKNVHLDDLRKFLAQRDFPLHESKRNQKAVEFLQIVDRIMAEHNSQK